MKTVYRFLLIAAVALPGINPAAAQSKITLSHLGVPSFHTNLTTAVAAAVNGDTLYLPGGIIQSTNFIISKSLHIIGTGHYPDSTLATNQTILGNLSFITGAGGGSIEGCIISTLNIGYAATQNITGFSVKRCSIGVFNLGYDNASTLENIMLTDNVFKNEFYIYSGYPVIQISRNIFNANNGPYCSGLTFNNNIFYVIPGYHLGLSHLSGCTLENNILILTNPSYNIELGSNSCLFTNNLFIPNVSYWGSNIQTNSILNQTTATTFTDANGTSFSYDHNYHLLSTSPGKNYGTDGTDVGIYGTIAPYKEGAVPSNPHIMSKSISAQTTPSGALNVNISVAAQDN